MPLDELMYLRRVKKSTMDDRQVNIVNIGMTDANESGLAAFSKAFNVSLIKVKVPWPAPFSPQVKFWEEVWPVHYHTQEE